jgi:hypothetical protein
MVSAILGLGTAMVRFESFPVFANLDSTVGDRRQGRYALLAHQVVRPLVDEALCHRNGGAKMKAVVAVMRSGLRLLYTIARDRRMFTVEPPTRHRAVG